MKQYIRYAPLFLVICTLSLAADTPKEALTITELRERYAKTPSTEVQRKLEAEQLIVTVELPLVDVSEKSLHFNARIFGLGKGGQSVVNISHMLPAAEAAKLRPGAIFVFTLESPSTKKKQLHPAHISLEVPDVMTGKKKYGEIQFVVTAFVPK